MLGLFLLIQDTIVDTVTVGNGGDDLVTGLSAAIGALIAAVAGIIGWFAKAKSARDK